MISQLQAAVLIRRRHSIDEALAFVALLGLALPPALAAPLPEPLYQSSFAEGTCDFRELFDHRGVSCSRWGYTKPSPWPVSSAS